MSKQARPNELGLLRQVVRNLAKRDLPVGHFGQDSLQAAGLVRGKITPAGLIGLLPGGTEPLQKLTEALFISLAGVERGTNFPTFEAQVFQAMIEQFLERDASAISDADLTSLCAGLEQWFAKRVSNRLIFVPSMISPWPSPPFSIGPVHFTHLEDFKSKYADPNAQDFRELYLNELIEAAAREGAHWMAEIEIDGCDIERATEIANLSVDLAITAIQMAAPNLDVKNMSRLFDRRGTGHVVTVHRSEGRFGGGFSRVEPGMVIGTNFLAKIVHDTKPLMDAVGHLVHSFSSGQYRMPLIEQAWCDAAYWLREGLVEPIDAIAVTKLETAIEVLLRSESSSGSENRILIALNTFFGLKPTDPIAPNSQTTAKQFAKGFVRDRSRVLHGTWSTLGSRLRTSRGALEHVATTLVRASAVELDSYLQNPKAADEIEAFMLWIAKRRGH